MVYSSMWLIHSAAPYLQHIKKLTHAQACTHNQVCEHHPDAFLTASQSYKLSEEWMRSQYHLFDTQKELIAGWINLLSDSWHRLNVRWFVVWLTNYLEGFYLNWPAESKALSLRLWRDSVFETARSPSLASQVDQLVFVFGMSYTIKTALRNIFSLV